jgi:hypothetical protein
MWQLGLVTGDGIPELEAVAGEPMLSVLIPTSPMPMTGFTATDNGTNLVGEVRHGINKAVLTTEDAEGKIYIRTLVGEGAEDSVVYNSAMELFFDPV